MSDHEWLFCALQSEVDVLPIVAVVEPDALLGLAAESNRSASDHPGCHLGQVDCAASVLDHEPSLDLVTAYDRSRTEFQPISESLGGTAAFQA